MSCIDPADIKLGFQFIAETQQEIADGRAEVTRIFDDISAKVEKIKVVMKSIEQQNDARIGNS